MEKSLSNLRGYNTIAISRRSRATPGAIRWRPSAPWCAASRRGHRGDAGRRLQPHRRGQRAGPHPAHRGIDNASYYRLAPKTRDHTTTGTGSIAQSHPSARTADGDGFAPLLGGVLPCRRVPFRPRPDPLARTPSGFDRNAAFLDRDPAGPGAGPGQAHRRTLGSSAPAATRSAASRPIFRMERPLPQRDAALLVRRRQPDRRGSSAA